MNKSKKGRLIVASSWECADLLYLTGFQAGDPFIYYAVDGDGHIVVTALEHARALEESRHGIEVIDRSSLIPAKNAKKDVKAIVGLLTRRHGVDEWEVPSYFPLGLAETLRADGVKITCAPKSFAAKRQVKRPSEIKEIRRAQRLAEMAMRAFESALRSSTIGRHGELMLNDAPFTSETARGLINACIAQNGGYPSATIVACGRDAAEPHNAGKGVLKAHQTIVVDIFPRLRSGYWGDITRTFVKGAAPVIVKKAHEAVRLAREKAKSLVRAGAIPEKLFQKAKDVLDQKGFTTGTRHGVHFGFFHGLGHGVGLEVHEAPRVGPGVTAPLKSGEVVTIEPGVYYPAWGGVRLEDLVVVRPGTAECLTDYPDMLEVE